MLKAYCNQTDNVWYCVVLNDKGEVEACQFSLKSREDAFKTATKNIPKKQEAQLSKAISDNVKSLFRVLVDIFKGKTPREEVKISLEGLPQFSREVLKMTIKIPKGFVSTYGIIAKAIGKPKASRAVGNFMAKNPFPLLVPCHRVVKSNLSLGNYRNGVTVKKMLLEKEGVKIYKKGKEYFVDKSHVYNF